MRRAPIVLAGTAAGLAGVLMFHPHSPATNLAALPPASGPTASQGTASQGASSNGTGESGSASTSTSGSSAAANGSSSAGSTGNGSSSATATTATYTGTRVTYSYGVLAVRITVSGHTIKDVGIASITEGGDFRSESIDQQSIPILEKETIDAQSATIQGVSGASYTSEGFVRSLQSALSRAGL